MFKKRGMARGRRVGLELKTRNSRSGLDREVLVIVVMIGKEYKLPELA